MLTNAYTHTCTQLRFTRSSNSSFLIEQQDAPLKVWRKLAFAFGGIPYQMCNTVIGVYFSIFLLEVAILDPSYVMVIILLGRVSDAVTDPIVGYLCSRTNTRFGRLRPWMICAAIPAGVVYTLLWWVPPGSDDLDHGEKVKFAYYLSMYLAFQICLTCIHVPYTALTMHLSHDNKDRDSATLYRMCFEILGMMIGIVIYTAYYVTFVEDKSDQTCDYGKRQPDENVRRAYRYHAVTLGAILIVCIVIAFLGVREQKDEVRKDKGVGFYQLLKEIFGFKPYTMLFCTYIFSSLSAQFLVGNSALYIKYTIGLEDQYPYVITVLLTSFILWMPFWQLVLVKFGKRTAFTTGLWLSTPPLLGLLFADFRPYSIYALAAFGGVGVSVGILLPWSMLPDVVDEASLKMNVRREEMLYAFFVFGAKFASGITLALSTGVYKIVGYDEQKCDQPWTLSLALKLIVSVPPILCVLLSLLFFHYYPITEQSRERTKNILQERRRSSVYQSSGGSGSRYMERLPSVSIPSQSSMVSEDVQESML